MNNIAITTVELREYFPENTKKEDLEELTLEINCYIQSTIHGIANEKNKHDNYLKIKKIKDAITELRNSLEIAKEVFHGSLGDTLLECFDNCREIKMIKNCIKENSRANGFKKDLVINLFELTYIACEIACKKLNFTLGKHNDSNQSRKRGIVSFLGICRLIADKMNLQISNEAVKKYITEAINSRELTFKTISHIKENELYQEKGTVPFDIYYDTLQEIKLGMNLDKNAKDS
ncbi:MAG: hypothetical protein WC756_10420 [Taibaiella sp.]|jgi:hypothetical protein